MNQVPPSLPSALARIRVVLSRTSHPGNIGSAARAMKTMGLTRLVLVNPRDFPSAGADALASGATDVLAGARVTATVGEALEGTVLAIGMTARRRDLSHEMVSMREAAPRAVAETAAGEVALVFGNEMSGLSNAELDHCQMAAMIPANPDYSSLNLAAAVQVACYELALAAQAWTADRGEAREPATHEEIEHLHAHFEEAMILSGFLDPQQPKRLMTRMRRLFARTRLEKEEVNILRGMLAAFTDRWKR